MHILQLKINGFETASSSLKSAIRELIDALESMEAVRKANDLPVNYWIASYSTSNFNLDFSFKQEAVLRKANDFLYLNSLKTDGDLGGNRIIVEAKVGNSWKRFTIIHEKKQKSSFADVGANTRATKVELIDF